VALSYDDSTINIVVAIIIIIINQLVSGCFLQLRRIKSCVDALPSEVANAAVNASPSPELTTATVCLSGLHGINLTVCSPC